MFKKLPVKLGIWSVVAVVAAFVINVGLDYLHWENTRAAELEAAVTICLMVALYYWARKLVFRPMKEIEEIAERIKAGDLNARTNITSSRELTVLSETLNSMVEKLAESNRQLQEYSRSLEKAVEERTRELNAERELRIALLTHDLKSPLTSILGYSELLLSGGRSRLDSDQEDSVRGIMQGGEKLLEMVEQYLELTKVEAGLAVVERKPLDPDALITNALSLLKVQAKEKGITLASEVASDIPVLLGDREKISRAVTNLVVNAIKYTPEGGWVKVKSSMTEADGGPFWEISVSDNGYGIAAGDLQKIFKTYYRSSSSAGTRGTGLGLAVVKSFVEAHGGSVHVESTPGNGSTFTVRIPIRRVDAGKTKGAAA